MQLLERRVVGRERCVVGRERCVVGRECCIAGREHAQADARGLGGSDQVCQVDVEQPNLVVDVLLLHRALAWILAVSLLTLQLNLPWAHPAV